VRSYVKVSVRNNLLSVKNIRSGTCAAPNAAFEVGNVTWCGPDEGASPALPVGSLVDHVVVHGHDDHHGDDDHHGGDDHHGDDDHHGGDDHRPARH
jgi:hypothetical protein